MLLIGWVDEFRKHLTLERSVCFYTGSWDIIIWWTVASYVKLDTSCCISRVRKLSPDLSEWLSISAHSLSLSHIDRSRSSLGLEFSSGHLSKWHYALTLHMIRKQLIVISPVWCNIITRSFDNFWLEFNSCPVIFLCCVHHSLPHFVGLFFEFRGSLAILMLKYDARLLDTIFSYYLGLNDVFEQIISHELLWIAHHKLFLWVRRLLSLSIDIKYRLVFILSQWSIILIPWLLLPLNLHLILLLLRVLLNLHDGCTTVFIEVLFWWRLFSLQIKWRYSIRLLILLSIFVVWFHRHVI